MFSLVESLVEKSMNQKEKALRTDNSGGFESVGTVFALALQNGRWMLRLVS